MSANATIKPGRELERVGRALHAGALRFPNLSTSGLRDLATLARWLAAVFDAKVEARSAPFPASLPPWLVMQWLPLREVAAALRVAWSWRLDCEHYFRVFAERHRIFFVPIPEFLIKYAHLKWETAAFATCRCSGPGG